MQEESYGDADVLRALDVQESEFLRFIFHSLQLHLFPT